MLQQLFKLAFYFFCFSTGLGAFEVVDENAVVRVDSGKLFHKYVAVYNFAPEQTAVELELLPLHWPNKQKPVYQVDLVKPTHSRVVLNKNSKSFFPLTIEAVNRLERGEYRYWLLFRQPLYEFPTEGLNYTGYQLFYQPLTVLVE